MELTRLTNEAISSSSAACLIDFAAKGEPLIISFGFYDSGGNPGFSYFGRLKKLELLTGRKLNKIFIRDLKNSWYHHGVQGLGGNVDETASSIRSIIEKIGPSKIITLGESMGGYAAIMFAPLLSADYTLSFGPLSCFRSDILNLIHDRRWMPVVKEIEANPPAVFYNDLPEMLAAKKHAGQVEVVFGTYPGHGVDRTEAVNPDAVHAMRFHGVNNVKLFPIHTSGHIVTNYLRNGKIIDIFFAKKLLGISLPSDGSDQIGLGKEWLSWIEENLKLGADPKHMAENMVKAGLSSDLAGNSIDYVQAQSVIRGDF